MFNLYKVSNAILPCYRGYGTENYKAPSERSNWSISKMLNFMFKEKTKNKI